MAFQTDICDGNSWVEMTEGAGALAVVECYQGWCGPSKAISATFKRIFYDNSDKPLKFYTANVDKVAALDSYKGKCQPLFLFYKDGKVVEKVVGVQAPVLTDLIMALCEPAKL